MRINNIVYIQGSYKARIVERTKDSARVIPSEGIDCHHPDKRCEKEGFWLFNGLLKTKRRNGTIIQ